MIRDKIKPNNHSIEVKASQAWCDITNALIDKYKRLAEEHPDFALQRLQSLEDLLIKEGYLCEVDITRNL